MIRVLFCFSMFLLFMSCGDDVVPKPKPYLKLEYKEPRYEIFEGECPFVFQISDQAELLMNENCWARIEYPKLKATIHLTYHPVNNNLNEILTDVEKLTFEHTVKANAIDARPYENRMERVFGKMYYVEGNVATNLQFRATDSVNHVISGALYFYTRPNYDSILPAIRYIEKDMTHIMETLQWK
jgi:gliding motility-associated lipoprotein GldD